MMKLVLFEQTLRARDSLCCTSERRFATRREKTTDCAEQEAMLVARGHSDLTSCAVVLLIPLLVRLKLICSWELRPRFEVKISRCEPQPPEKWVAPTSQTETYHFGAAKRKSLYRLAEAGPIWLALVALPAADWFRRGPWISAPTADHTKTNQYK